MTSCRLAKRWIERAADGELSLEHELRLEQHLAHCAACSSTRDRQQRLEELFATRTEPRYEQLDIEGAVAGVQAAIAARPVDAAPPLRLNYPLRSVGLGAAAAAAAALWLLTRPSNDVEQLRDSEGESGGELTQAVAPPEPSPDAVAQIDADTSDLAGHTNALTQQSVERLQPERLASVRSSVGGWLAESFSALQPSASDAQLSSASERLEERALLGGAADWPLVRLAEQLLQHEDEQRARAAALYLGQRGDALSARGLGRVLRHESIAPFALRSLIALGEDGIDALAEALLEPRQCAGALDALVAIGGESAASALETVLADSERFVELEHAEQLRRALPRFGEHGLASALRLAARDELSRSELRAACDALPQAADVLGMLVQERAQDFEEGVLLDAVAHLRPAAALPWVEERAQDRATEAEGLACLEQFEGLEALRSSWRLLDSGRVSPRCGRDSLHAMLARDPERNKALSSELLAKDQCELAEGWLEVLIESGASASAPALLELARSAALAKDLRLLAVLACGELGTLEHVEQLRAGYAQLDVDDRRLAAAHLVALYEIAGEEPALDTLGSLAPRESSRLGALLRQVAARGESSVSLLRLARELTPHLRPTTSSRSHS